MAAFQWTPRRIRLGILLAVVGGGAVLMLSVAFNCRAEGIVGPRRLEPEAQLVREAEAALAVIPTESNRKNRRPVGFDDVLRPVDDLLAHAGEAAAREDFDGAVRCAGEAARLAEAGLDMALRSAGNPRTQRFPEQIAEAARISAGVRLASLRRALAGSDNPPPETALSAIRRDVVRGLRNRPDDAQLLFLSAAVDQLSGNWPAAAKSLETALVTDPRFADAWNELALVRIQLRDFDGAETAFGRAMETARPADNETPSATWKTAARNLADFHYNLALFHRDELLRQPARADADADATRAASARAGLERHRLAARKAYAEVRRTAAPEELPRLNEALADLERLAAAAP